MKAGMLIRRRQRRQAPDRIADIVNAVSSSPLVEGIFRHRRRAGLAIAAGCALAGLQARRPRPIALPAPATSGDGSGRAATGNGDDSDRAAPGNGDVGGRGAPGNGDDSGRVATGTEIERKFLVGETPADLDRYPSEEIEQGYLAVDGKVEVRLRRRGDQGTLLTVKGGAGKVRAEAELELDEARFVTLWPLTAGRRLRKVRHRISGDDGLTIELDVYAGWLKGLTIAEVEFPSVEASARFEPPSWFGDEVTDDPEYRNRSLAEREAQARAERVFRLRTDETVPDGIRRVALGQIDEVLDRLEGRTEEDLGTAIHEARKSLKRLRATARLVRPELGRAMFRRENERFRDAGRALSGPRDSQVLIETLDALAEHYPVEFGAIDVGTFRAALTSARDAAQGKLDEGAPERADVESGLRAARARVDEWPIADKDFGAVAGGLERTYRRGRGAYRAAVHEATPEHLHEWRKRVKDLWHSLQILRAASPRRMKALARTAHDLSNLLGDDHDLAVLEQQVEAHRAEFADSDSATLLTGLCERRRAELQVKSFAIGFDLYGDSPSKFVRRIKRAWRKRVRG